MPFKPNYRQARGERDRSKQHKKDEKLRRREVEAARRKAEHEPDGTPPAAPGTGSPEDEAAFPSQPVNSGESGDEQ
jgi:hypothetical protein